MYEESLELLVSWDYFWFLVERDLCCLFFLFESSVTWWLMVVSKLPAIVISFVYSL